MSDALRLYEQLTEAQDEKTKARLIAEAFEQLEDRYPHLKDVTTQGQARETELRLQKEINAVEPSGQGSRSLAAPGNQGHGNQCGGIEG